MLSRNAGRTLDRVAWFYLVNGRIFDKKTRDCHNVVFHESGLSNRRGCALMSWQVLDWANQIPVTLFVAVAVAVAAESARSIYLQDSIRLWEYEPSQEC